MALLDGQKTASEMFSKLKPRVDLLKEKGINTKLAFFLIGDNPASVAYVNMKKKASEKIGIISEIVNYDESVTQKELLEKIQELNQDTDTHGMMVQLPIPNHLDTYEITNSISSIKDSDGLHAYNFGEMSLSKEAKGIE